MKLLVRLIRSIISVVLVLSLVLGLVGTVLVRNSFPEIEGTTQLAGLDAEVRVVRDTQGVPHIYASSRNDLYMAQGYVEAQDRFFQMDFWRHIGSATLSEMFGDSSLETDQFLRTLQLESIAELEFAAMPPDQRAYLESYAAGVNAYLSDHQGSNLSLEYAVLGLTNRSYEPEPWNPVNTLTWAKMMAWDLGGNMDKEIDRAILSATMTSAQVDQLYPPYPSDKPFIVRGSELASPSSAPELPDISALFAEVSSRIDGITALTGEIGADIGSNNWVVAGDLTDTGMPILANDPHLSIQMPSIWYQVGLHCEGTGEGCPHEVAGFGFPGMPGVIIGHTEQIGWGVTNLAPDVQDLYIEKINPANPDQYEVNGAWVDMEITMETIKVAGAEDVELVVRHTRHGPIISDVFGSLDDYGTRTGLETPAQYAVALRWTALEPNHLAESIFELNEATNFDEFRQALEKWDVPAQNFVYADTSGNIGYQMPGNVPIRNAGDGRYPVPGWTNEFEWSGYVPFDDLPSVLNPASGYIATANNAVVDVSYPYFVTADWAYGYRAERIVSELEAASGPITTADMSTLQGDAYNLNAEEIVPYLLDHETSNVAIGAGKNILRSWDLRNDADSQGAAVYAAVWRHLLLETLKDDLPEDAMPNGRAQWFVVMELLMRNPQDPFWDDQRTEAIENRDEIIERAFAAAMTELEASLGSNQDSWSWGRLHEANFRNGSLGESGIAPIEWLFNRQGFAVGGGTSIVNATSWNPNEGYAVTALPSLRMVLDFSDLSQSTAIHTTGQSGHAFATHYIDMAEPWASNDTNPMWWTSDQVDADADAVLVLTP